MSIDVHVLNEAGVITNTIVIESAEDFPNLLLVPVGEFGGGVGDSIIENTLIPKTPVRIVPQEVTMRQARTALHLAGLLGGVQAAIDSLVGDTKAIAQIEWDTSKEVQRYRPLVINLGAAMGLTEEQLDDLFITAATIS